MYKDIPGYEGLYQINDKGQVRSLDRLTRDGRHIKGLVLTPQVKNFKNHEYLYVNLRKDNKRKSCYIHKTLEEVHGIVKEPSDLIEESYVKCSEKSKEQVIEMYESVCACRDDFMIRNELLHDENRSLTKLRDLLLLLNVMTFISALFIV